MSKKNIKPKLKSYKSKRKIGMVHGVFDIVHLGHILHFKQAKKKVDYLIASITVDQFVNKGPGKPIFKNNDRKEFLESIDYIDEVVFSNSLTALNNIRKIKPDIYFKGLDYTLNEDVTKNINLEKKEVEKYGGKLEFTNSRIFSSSKIINENFNYINPEIKPYFKKTNKNKLIKNIYEIKKKNLKILIIGDAILDNYIFSVPSGKANKSSNISVRFLKSKIYAGGSMLVANFLSSFTNKKIDLVWPSNSYNDKYIELLDQNINPLKIKTKTKIISKNRFLDNYSHLKYFQYSKNEDLILNILEKKNIIKFIKRNKNKYDLIYLYDFGYLYGEEEITSFINSKLKNNVYINCQSNSYNFGFNIPKKYSNGKVLCMDEVEFRLCVNNNKDEIKGLIEK